MKTFALLVVLMNICLVALGQSKPSAAQKIKGHLEVGMPGPKIIEVLGLPDKIKPDLDITIYYYEGVEVHCFNDDLMKGEMNSGAVTKLSDINCQKIAWFVYVDKPSTNTQSSAQDTVLLTREAVLYYLCKCTQDRNGYAGKKYYYSSAGYVYYRDEYTRPFKMSSPPSPIKIPVEQVKTYPELVKYLGYNNRNIGKLFRGLP